MKTTEIAVSPESVVVLAVDAAHTKSKKDTTETTYERRYFVCSGADFLAGKKENIVTIQKHKILTKETETFFKHVSAEQSQNKVYFIIYPTRTYSTGFGGNLFTDVAPEDRMVLRELRSHFANNIEHLKVSLKDTDIVASLPNYLANEGEKKKFADEQKSFQCAEESIHDEKVKRFPIGFDTHFIKNMGEIFKSVMTRPNKQDFFYLYTKTFGINLVVRVLFAAKGVQGGDLPMHRAILSTSWYQLQDIVFTIFGQTYMKFLGRMAGMLRVVNVYIGDFLFVYIQFCFFEFANRLILGPIGENPLVYTWQGIGLILLNNLQGLISGGPLTPAINKIRRSGVISHSTMMHFYQLGSFCFYFGMFATYGYQWIYTLLTSSVLIFAWGSYIVFSIYFKDPEMTKIAANQVKGKLDTLVAQCYQQASI